ncbi:MAG TPA: alcohol dehydrogenase catalytic domain-containing protein [Dermatophilaceae bacterium]|nr:alcohol dehydrogenase catalytic domain-containing protein [Dermatophilaceae bacterium]
MRAVSYAAYGELPVLRDLPDPTCPDGGILVRVGATGVCRSDWHAWLGHDPVPLPMVPGHEFAGVVAAVGSGVERWQVGDRVTVPFACGCGVCEVCRAGDTHVCPAQTQPGFTGWGSFADLVAVSAADANVVALPDEVGFVEAAALGCRLATAYRAVVSVGRLARGEWLVVHGCGGVGLSAVMVGVALGARVVGVDVSAGAREAALRLGAEVALAPGADLVSVTGGGAHLSVDAIGSVEVLRASVLSLRPRGRHVQVGLLLGDAAEAAVPMGRVIARELEVLGSHGMPSRDYPGLLALVASRAIDPRLLVGRVIGLDGAGAALAAMSDGGAASGGAGAGAGEGASAGMTVVEITH